MGFITVRLSLPPSSPSFSPRAYFNPLTSVRAVKRRVPPHLPVPSLCVTSGIMIGAHREHESRWSVVACKSESAVWLVENSLVSQGSDSRAFPAPKPLSAVVCMLEIVRVTQTLVQRAEVPMTYFNVRRAAPWQRREKHTSIRLIKRDRVQQNVHSSGYQEPGGIQTAVLFRASTDT